jgi:hypothetical protein
MWVVPTFAGVVPADGIVAIDGDTWHCTHHRAITTAEDDGDLIGTA